ncbi:MAG TPA: hypothetical protein VHJ82_03515 [Actinomycetota bacterium]|nr:hypothetical protein [Actinomycetota bacterium]
MLSLLVILSGSAHAAPIDVRRDRSDNTYTFTYNADDGEITLAASSRRITRNDRVSFLLGIRSDPEAEVGERLIARISLQLHSRKPLRYDGIFTLVVKTPEGDVVLKQTREDDYVLRPRDGERRAHFNMRFDLPSGEYEAHAKFRSDT